MRYNVAGEQLDLVGRGVHRPESHSIERSRVGFGGLPAGSYEVKVQYKNDGSGTFQINGWHLTVERSQVS